MTLNRLESGLCERLIFFKAQLPIPLSAYYYGLGALSFQKTKYPCITAPV